MHTHIMDHELRRGVLAFRFFVCVHELNSLWQAMARQWLAHTIRRFLRPPMQINSGVVEERMATLKIRHDSDASDS